MLFCFASLSSLHLSCGLMLTLSTNLALWIAAVTDESLHQTIIPADTSNMTKFSYRSLYMNKSNQSIFIFKK